MGILLYEMLIGVPPFINNKDEYSANFIEDLDVEYPKKFKISDEAKDLIGNYFFIVYFYLNNLSIYILKY